jgi:hypothetical protein
MDKSLDVALKSRDLIFLLKHLKESKRNEWFPYVKNGYILLARRYSPFIFSPLTAIFFEITGREIESNSFWCPPMEELGFDWWNIIEMTAAEIPGATNRHFRNKILVALGLPENQ